MAAITFNSLVNTFKIRNSRPLSDWIQKAILSTHNYPVAISFIFCDDDYLFEINKKYLGHRTLTDIVTFNYNESYHISGDIFISIDRVRENAGVYKTTFEKELHRVMIHGVLHLLGFDDKTERDKKKMTAKEDEFLLQLKI